MKRICTICARSGSKSVKEKNLRPILGVPLIAHSIRQAQDSGLFEVIAVSSDSQVILNVADDYGADYTINRPHKMATDTATKLPAILHCLQEVEHLSGHDFDILVDLDASSPLRLPKDIVGAVTLLENHSVSNVITGSPARRSPYFNLIEMDSTGVVNLSKSLDQAVLRRQDSPRCFDMNASIYVWERNSFVENTSIFKKDTMMYEMPEERSIDIDHELDYEMVRFLMERNQIRNNEAHI